MRQFDSLRNVGEAAGEGGDRRNEGRKSGSRMLSSSAFVRHREVIGFFEMLTSVIRRDRPMRGRVSR